MTMKLINYCDCDGVAAILARDDDNGVRHGFRYIRGKWVESDDFEIGTDCQLVEQATFETMYPEIGLPAALEDA